jgi:iron-sulfur cluster assembly protein
MITITPRAAAQVLKSTAGAGLRLVARLDDKGAIEYGMGIDERAEGDAQTVSNGVTVLVAAGSVELLTGATLDYVELNPGEWRFIFINPNDPSHKAPKEPGT